MSSAKQYTYECETCGKKFTRKDYLTRHEFNHNDIKPYKCDRCGLFFTRSDLLSKHCKSKSHLKEIDKETDGAQKDLKIDNGTSSNAVAFHDTAAAVSRAKCASTNKRPSEADLARKKAKKSGIANLLNANKTYPTPPPQPTIILPKEKSLLVHNNQLKFGDKRFDNFTNYMKNGSESHEKVMNSDSDTHGVAVGSSAGADDDDGMDNANVNVNDDGAANDESIGDGLYSSLFYKSDNVSSNTDLSGGFLDNLLWLFNDLSPYPTENWSSETSYGFDFGQNSVPELDNYMNHQQWQQQQQQQQLEIQHQQQQQLQSTKYVSQLLSQSSETAISLKVPDKIKLFSETRSNILNLFPTVSELTNIPLKRFDEYLDLYWFNFAQTFPIIHQSTFNPNTVNIYLLTSMLIIGIAHSLDKLEYEISIKLNKKFRKIIRHVIDDEIELQLPLIQALLLHNFSAKNFGDLKLNQLAQVDHGANIMYLRFSGMMENLAEPPIKIPSYLSGFNAFNESCSYGEMSADEIMLQWRNWIQYESCKRAVFFEFVCDTQHVTFSRLELLSTFDVKLELPCTDKVWNSSDPIVFLKEYEKQPKGQSSKGLQRSSQGAVRNGAKKLYKSEHATFGYSEKDEKSERIKNAPGTINEAQERNNNDKDLIQDTKQNEGTSLEFVAREIRFVNKFGDNDKSSDNVRAKIKPNDSAPGYKTRYSFFLSKWPNFLYSLKSMMTSYKESHREYSMDCFSLFSRYIILHGLLRICRDMKSQGLLDIGIVSKKKFNEFYEKLERAFINWKGYFDLHVKLHNAQYSKSKPQDISNGLSNSSDKLLMLNDYGPTNASWANLSFYYTGLFVLYSDTTALMRYAQDFKNSSQWRKTTQLYNLKEMEIEKNSQSVALWAKSTNGEKALFEACNFLKLVYKNEQTLNTFSHIPGTVYIAALILWCYESKNLGQCDYKQSFPKLYKYFKYTQIDIEKSKKDAVEYLNLVLHNGSPDEGAPSPVPESHQNDVDNDKSTNLVEFYLTSKKTVSKRRKTLIGVLCYVLHLLKNCKWSYSVDLFEKLEVVVNSFE